MSKTIVGCQSDAGPRHRCACAFVPLSLFAAINRSPQEDLRALSLRAYGATEAVLLSRERSAEGVQGGAVWTELGAGRQVHDLANQRDPLPGILARREGALETGDKPVDAAYAMTGLAHDFFLRAYNWRSLDGRGCPIISSVRYGQNLPNAFWVGDQIVFGEGLKPYFRCFTSALDVAVHELSHGIIAYTSKLHYSDEPGALNESFCDVMGELCKQWVGGAEAHDADWMLGKDLLGDIWHDVPGLRTFKAEPAFRDHPTLGTDPQVKNMSQFVRTSDDNGGVHINSGIPNHAFYLAAEAIGGRAWDRAGSIWFKTFTALGSDADFSAAATATILTAERLYGRGEGEARAVREAWRAVGVEVEV